jgi:hypothetical protein
MNLFEWRTTAEKMEMENLGLVMKCKGVTELWMVFFQQHAWYSSDITNRQSTVRLRRC